VPSFSPAAAGNPYQQGGNFYEPGTRTYVLPNGNRVDSNSGNATQQDAALMGPGGAENLDVRAMYPPNGGLGVLDGTGSS
jgi:hypothetical protein